MPHFKAPILSGPRCVSWGKRTLWRRLRRHSKVWHPDIVHPPPRGKKSVGWVVLAPMQSGTGSPTRGLISRSRGLLMSGRSSAAGQASISFQAGQGRPPRHSVSTTAWVNLPRRESGQNHPPYGLRAVGVVAVRSNRVYPCPRRCRLLFFQPLSPRERMARRAR